MRRKIAKDERNVFGVGCVRGRHYAGVKGQGDEEEIEEQTDFS